VFGCFCFTVFGTTFKLMQTPTVTVATRSIQGVGQEHCLSRTQRGEETGVLGVRPRILTKDLHRVVTGVCSPVGPDPSGSRVDPRGCLGEQIQWVKQVNYSSALMHHCATRLPSTDHADQVRPFFRSFPRGPPCCCVPIVTAIGCGVGDRGACVCCSCVYLLSWRRALCDGPMCRPRLVGTHAPSYTCWALPRHADQSSTPNLLCCVCHSRTDAATFDRVGLTDHDHQRRCHQSRKGHRRASPTSLSLMWLCTAQLVWAPVDRTSRRV
jgi:hypothetical protein